MGPWVLEDLVVLQVQYHPRTNIDGVISQSHCVKLMKAQIQM